MQNVPKIVRDRLRAETPAVNHPDADLLTAFAEQSLPAEERATMLEHLARCGDCRDVVALALPPTETLQAGARPARSAWFTWPALRWGFVAAGVVIVSSIGFRQLQRHSESSKMSAVSSPNAQVARNEARPQLSTAPSAPVAKADSDAATSGRTDGVSKAPDFAAEEKASAPAAPPSATPVAAFHGVARGSFGGAVGGPKPPSQFLINNNVQQQTSNAAPAPILSLPTDQLSSAKQSRGANEAVAMGAAAPGAIDTDGARMKAQLRDQPAESQQSADKSSISKSKLPVTQPSPGQIVGHVVDASGAVVPNARITVTPAMTGKSATAVTDSQGAFLIADLPTGNYKAQAQAPGFNTTVQDLNYDASRPSTYNFTMNVGSVSETVEVSSAQSAQLQTLPATVGGPINSNGRNFTGMVSPSAGLPPRWTVSAGGALQRSFDQGKTWLTVNVNASPESLASQAYAKESRAKEVSREKDGDKKLVKREVASPVFRTVTAAGSEVWAGGSAGALYHSLDAGNHWNRVVPTGSGTTLTGDIISLDFSDSQNGKVTTSTPEVWTTNDAGQSWQKQ